MPHDNSSNARASDKTSTSAPATRGNSPAGLSSASGSTGDAAALSESEFLTRQSADAKAAISRVVSDLQHDLTQTVDPRAWLQSHPWTTLGATAIAGFVAAAMVVPSKEEQMLKKLRAIEKALTPDPAAPAVNGDATVDPSRRAAGGGFLAGLAGQVLRAVQPVLMSAITAGVTAKTVKEEPPTGGADPSTATSGAAPAEGRSVDPEI
jgi:hypothetical protein